MNIERPQWSNVKKFLTFNAEVNRVYSDSQSQFRWKVFIACVNRRIPINSQEIFFAPLLNKKKVCYTKTGANRQFISKTDNILHLHLVI